MQAFTDLQSRRERERAKYAQLRETRPGYGGSNHGARLAARVIAWGRSPIVDLGCGHNDFARSLRREGVDAVGVDFANEHADILSPMHAVPAANGAFAGITAFDSLEHLLEDEVPAVLDEMRRICQPGSPFLFTVAYRPSNILCDGENLHPTVRPAAWWADAIARVAETVRVDGSVIEGILRG